MYPGNNKYLLHIYNLKMSQSYVGMKPFNNFLKCLNTGRMVNITYQYEDTTLEGAKFTAYREVDPVVGHKSGY